MWVQLLSGLWKYFNRQSYLGPPQLGRLSGLAEVRAYHSRSCNSCISHLTILKLISLTTLPLRSSELPSKIPWIALLIIMLWDWKVPHLTAHYCDYQRFRFLFSLRHVDSRLLLIPIPVKLPTLDPFFLIKKDEGRNTFSTQGME